MTSRGAVQALCAAALMATTSLRSMAQEPPSRDTLRRDSLPATLIGRVTDTVGAGLAGAEITLFKSDKVHVISGDSGEFRIAGLPPGTNVFNVRRIGFEAASFTAVLKSGRTHRATLSLTPTAAQTLPTVSVSDTMNTSHWLDVFDRRKNTSRGTFFTRADIEKKSVRTGTDIIRSVPGVRLVTLRGGAGNQVEMVRGSGAKRCIPTMYVHNIPYSGMLDDFLAEDIEALEVYVGISEIPPELDKNGKGICGAIVVWTRDPNKRPPG